MQFLFPLNEIATNFFDALKAASSGYATFDYEDAGYRRTELARLEVRINGRCVDELASIVHASRSRQRAKAIAARLKEELPRQQFAIAVQVAVGSRVLAREDVKALRKDVTAKCYGGDVGRKMKLLKLQAEGKKKLKRVGNIEISKDTFIKIVAKDS